MADRVPIRVQGHSSMDLRLWCGLVELSVLRRRLRKMTITFLISVIRCLKAYTRS